MLFAKFALAALPLIGSAFAAPALIKKDLVVVEDRDINILNIVNNFKQEIVSSQPSNDIPLPSPRTVADDMAR